MKEFTKSPGGVLASGWWLAASPYDVRAWVQWELLERLQGDIGSRAVRIAWPSRIKGPDAGDWEISPTHGGVSSWGRLIFEQVGLPRAASRLHPAVVFIPYTGAPLAMAAPTACLAAASGQTAGGVIDRLRASAGRAGAEGAQAVIGWMDQPEPGFPADRFQTIEPAVSPAFDPTPRADDSALRADLGLADDYVLAIGASASDTDLLTAAWSWMAPSLGSDAKLILVPGAVGAEPSAKRGAFSADPDASIMTLERIDRRSLPAVLRGASLFVFGPGIASPQILRWATASGCPVAGVDTASSRSVLGRSGFLVADGDARALAAAGLSLLVDSDNITGRLRDAGLALAEDYHRAWRDGALGRALRLQV